MMIDLSQFYSGGYFLIRANDPDWGDEWRSGLLPTKLISLSQCIGRVMDISWGWMPGNKEAALKFGISEEKWHDFVAWCQEAHEVEIDIWSMFYSVDGIRRFIQRFDLPTEDLHIIGIGLLSRSDIIDYFKTSYSLPENYGIEKQIARTLPLEKSGQQLGFEIVSYDGYGNLGHSWLCGGLHEDMLKLFDQRPNAYGLIDTQEHAVKLYEWIKEDEMKGHRSEPEPYFPWLLTDYPLTSER